MSTARAMGRRGSPGSAVATCTFTTRKLTTFVVGHSELDTMVNDYSGGEVVVQSGHCFSR